MLIYGRRHYFYYPSWQYNCCVIFSRMWELKHVYNNSCSWTPVESLIFRHDYCWLLHACMYTLVHAKSIIIINLESTHVVYHILWYMKISTTNTTGLVGIRQWQSIVTVESQDKAGTITILTWNGARPFLINQSPLWGQDSIIHSSWESAALWPIKLSCSCGSTSPQAVDTKQLRVERRYYQEWITTSETKWMPHTHLYSVTQLILWCGGNVLCASGWEHNFMIPW